MLEYLDFLCGPRMSISRGTEAVGPFLTKPEIIHCHLCVVLMITSDLLKPTQIRGKGTQILPLGGRSVKEFADVFQNPTVTVIAIY